MTVRLLQASATGMPTTRYKNDGALRRRLFTQESMSHPAKGHLGMWEDIIQRYTQAGETILDPMAGVGASLLAALMGRNVVCVELEQHFYDMLLANWAKARQHPMLGYSLGSVTIIHGDARNLSGLLADAVITSPPYEGIETPPSGGSIAKGADRSAHSHAERQGRRYTRPVDAVVTSPPYGHDAEHDQHLTSQMKHPPGTSRTIGYSETTENIGNQKGAAYWESMRIVYGQCYAVLKPGGVMALVVKGFTRDGKYVDLPSQTVELCESLGFRLFDRWARELWSLSFWRVLQKRRDPAAFDNRLMFEEVLAFRKPADAVAREPSIGCVLTSQPYERTVSTALTVLTGRNRRMGARSKSRMASGPMASATPVRRRRSRRG